MSDNTGYIPLSRKFFEHELWLEPRVFSRAEAFADLLRRVRFEANPGTLLIGAQSITIERGEVAASIRFLAKNWGWSKNKVDKFLDYLAFNGMITRRKPYESKSGTRNGTATRTAPTIIKLCNFDKYNPIPKKTGHKKGHETGHERDTTGTSINKENNGNNITTTTSTDVEDSGVSVRDNIISYPVEDYNAGAREETDSPESDHPKRKSRKTLRKDDAGIEEARILTWRDDFEIYKNELRKAYKTLLQDDAWISTQQRFNPNLNIALSLEKACVNFWATEAGWQHKRKQRTKTINWRQTLTNSINSPQNKVYNDNGISKKTANNGVSEDFKRGVLETLLSGGNTE